MAARKRSGSPPPRRTTTRQTQGTPVLPRSAQQGPWLAAALLCERVLEEKDGTLSAVRVVDRLRITLVAQQEDGQVLQLGRDPIPKEVIDRLMPPRPLTLLVMLKDGTEGDQARLRIDTWAPGDKQRKSLDVGPPTFTGVMGSFNLIMRMQAKFTLPGRYWFDISLDDRLLSRIPLDVIFAPPDESLLETVEEFTVREDAEVERKGD